MSKSATPSCSLFVIQVFELILTTSCQIKMRPRVRHSLALFRFVRQIADDSIGRPRSGELLAWDPGLERHLPFGTLKTTALGA
jgi:hypothetical protein